MSEKKSFPSSTDPPEKQGVPADALGTTVTEQKGPDSSVVDSSLEGGHGLPIQAPMRYQLTKILGEGGFGTVYLAHDAQLHRFVALKVPHAEFVSRPEDAEAHLLEARTVANLDHPNIVPVYDVGHTPQCPCFIVSKFIDGTSLASRIKEGRPAFADSARLVATIADALHYAHGQGLVHRDIKPANILLDKTGKPYVADFGVALREDQVDRGSKCAGTPAYMSPEQAGGQGHWVDGRSDIFSVGVVLYELLTGRRPFHAEARAELLDQIMHREARPPRQWQDTIPMELERICLKGLAKRPTDRYTTAKDMADDLRHFLEPAAEPGAAADHTFSRDAGANAPGNTPPRPQVKGRKRTPPRARIVPSKWVSDANQIDIDDLKDVVFRNPIIDEFLDGRGKHFLSANKGLGKTLLLTCKRSLLTSEATRSQVFVPEGKPYLDFMSDIPEQSGSHEAFLSELANTKRLWGLALRVSALSCQPALFGAGDAAELKRWPRRLAGWLKGEKVEPTVVFKEVLGYSLGQINTIINENMSFLEHKFRQIHGACYLFIDKVDQGIQSLERRAWVHVQAGLIEAAWDTMSANNHVKIYASIRQEAYSNYRSNIKTNLHGATTIIEYSDADLQKLLDQLTNYYESSKTFKEFVSLNVIRHPHAAFPEDSFHYLNRHTLGRPRDLVIIAAEFSRPEKPLTEQLYRRLVSNTSATVLVANIFEEMRVFLDCLEDERERLRFFALLPCNVLTRQDAIRIFCAFNGLPAECLEGFGTSASGMHHPFWELYSAGLFGVVVEDPDHGRPVQRFKQPHDTIGDTPAALPDAAFYLIHPALDGLIRKHRMTGGYQVLQHVIVGHNCPWSNYYGALRELELELIKEADAKRRESVHALLRQVIPLLNDDKPAQAAALLTASGDGQAVTERLTQGPHDLYRLLQQLIP